jgi:hypothetical protein
VTAGAAIGGDRYRDLVAEIRDAVDAALPSRATIAVVSRGDPNLLELGGRTAWHFPQTEDGTYTGFHPVDSEDAIKRLEALGAKGADYLLFPSTARWWLEYYEDFARHLDRWYRRVTDEADTCLVYSLREPPTEAPDDADEAASLRHNELVRQLEELAAALLPPEATVLVVGEDETRALGLAGLEARRFPRQLDPPGSEELLAELEDARMSGAEFLVIPGTALWWLDTHPRLKRHLQSRYQLVVRQEHVCLVYGLCEQERYEAPSSLRRLFERAFARG